MRNEYESKSFLQYKKDISKYPLLSESEGEDLFLRLKKGDPAAREKLINSYQTLVKNTAMCFSDRANLMDLIQEGNLGLARGIDKAAKNFKSSLSQLGTYLAYWVRGKMLDYIEESASIIRVPKPHHTARRILFKVEEDFLSINGRRPSIEDFVSELNKRGNKKDSAKQIENLVRTYLNLRVYSLDDPITKDTENDFSKITISYKEEELSEKTEFEVYLKNHVSKHLKKLEEQERTVLYRVFVDKLSLKETGYGMGLNRKKVRSIYVSAMYKLRTRMSRDPAIRRILRENLGIKNVSY